MRSIVALVLLGLLAACYPALDWREIRSDEGRFSVLLPSKPRIESMPLSAARPEVLLHQWSAQARKTAFAIGYADLPPSDSTAGTTLRNALLHNISGKVVRDDRVEAGGMPGRETVAEGRIGDSPVTLHLRTFSVDVRLFQLAVLGPAEDFQPSEIETFFLSFKPVPVKR